MNHGIHGKYNNYGYQFKVGQLMFLLFTHTLRQAQEASSLSLSKGAGCLL